MADSESDPSRVLRIVGLGSGCPLWEMWGPAHLKLVSHCQFGVGD